MSLLLSNHVQFSEQLQHYKIKDGIELYTRIISGPREGRTAIFIHGGGSGGNHTMLLRPAKWLIEQGLFAKVILPDRRGEGLSTPLTKILSIKDHSMDMKGLLDALNINEKITAIGLSYGGPIALELAGLDSRIDEVILMASSASLRQVKGLRGFLYRNHLLEKIMKSFYKKNLGRLDPIYPNFEKVYDLQSNKELTRYFLEAIQHTDKKMLESLMLQNASTLDQKNSAISSDIKLDIPIYQVIGSKDEIWETDMTPYQGRFPNIKSYIVNGETHKGVMLHADKFYRGLAEVYKTR